MVGGSYYDFDQLGAEFMLAGVAYTSLATDGLTIFTYDEMANQISLPPEADPIIAAHVPAHLQRDLVAQMAQPAVGLSILDLPQDLLLLLLTGLAYKAGVIDRTTLAVLPIDSWLK